MSGWESAARSFLQAAAQAIPLALERRRAVQAVWGEAPLPAALLAALAELGPPPAQPPTELNALAGRAWEELDADTRTRLRRLAKLLALEEEADERATLARDLGAELGLALLRHPDLREGLRAEAPPAQTEGTGPEAKPQAPLRAPSKPLPPRVAPPGRPLPPPPARPRAGARTGPRRRSWIAWGLAGLVGTVALANWSDVSALLFPKGGESPAVRAERARLSQLLREQEEPEATPRTEPERLGPPEFEPPPRALPAEPLPAGLRATETPGEYLNLRDGSLLVWIPPASFQMGSYDPDLRLPPPDAPQAYTKPVPPRDVTLSQGYFIGKHEVTWAQYLRFCEANARPAPDTRVGGEEGALTHSAHPVANVSWEDAQAYARWAGLRLPTSAEWELAARGLDRRNYPWGDEPPTPERANLAWGDGRPGDGHPYSSPAGIFGPNVSPFGVADLAGNVWEWVADWARSDRAEREALAGIRAELGIAERGATQAEYARSLQVLEERWRRDPRGPRQGEHRVIRGGSWASPPEHCHAGLVAMRRPDVRQPDLGFRIAR